MSLQKVEIRLLWDDKEGCYKNTEYGTFELYVGRDTKLEMDDVCEVTVTVEQGDTLNEG